jgi:predicted DsbA family dithiol-disulfide isomerase
MATTVPVFFDFACPWSYSARGRERAYQRDLGVRFAYAPWELQPDAPLEGRPNEHRDVGPRLRSFAQSGGRDLKPRAWSSNTHRALRGLFYARARGAEEAYVDRMFEAYWEDQRDVNDEEVLRRVARESGLDEDDYLRAANDAAWDHLMLGVDAWGEKLGVETTVTYVLPGDDGRPEAYQALGTVDDVRRRLDRVKAPTPTRAPA